MSVSGQQVAARTGDGTVSSECVNDPTGTSLVLVDGNGDEDGRILYDSFGMVMENTLTAELTGALLDVPDAATGLVHLGGGRWYDPALGRPLQPNPAGGPPTVPQALNRYAAATVGYGYDAVGNRTHLTYPDGKVVTYTYDADNRLTYVEDWNHDLTGYEYDVAGRLITTTHSAGSGQALPNGVVTINGYDAANRLTSLRHTGDSDALIAEYLYELDGVGNRRVATETLLLPGMAASIEAYQESNGLLVLEAENGTTTAGSTHDWDSQTAQSGYGGDGYLRALPDVGQRYEADDLTDSPRQSFTVQIQNPDNYTVWVRGMAPDAAGDSLHVGVDGSFDDNAAFTGFTNQWNWSRQTMSDTQASLSLTSSGVYTLALAMREDGVRIDRMLLVTDTNYIPSGIGPAESELVTVDNITSQTIYYTYDPLYRLTEAAYSGILSGTYNYEYDAEGNRIAYDVNITTTESITYTYDAANRLVESMDLISSGVTTYDWDDASRLITTTVAGDVSRVYEYSQGGELLSADVDGPLTTFAYDGEGNRLQMSVSGEITIYHLDYAAGRRTLFEEGGAFADTKHYLYGYACLGELVNANTTNEEWRYYHHDGNGLVRQTTDETDTVTLAWTYSPNGAILVGEEGPVTYLDCGDGAVYDWSTGLIFKNGNYFDPNTGIWLTMTGAVVWQVWEPQPGKRSRRDRRKKLWLSFLLLLVVLLALSGCQGGSSGITPTPSCTPELVEAALPSLAPPVIGTRTEPATPTPISTSRPSPTNTSMPWTPTPTSTPSPWLPFPVPNFKLANPFGTKDFLTLCTFGDADLNCGLGPLGGGQATSDRHQGIDLVTVDDADDPNNSTSSSNFEYRRIHMPVKGTLVKDSAGDPNLYIRPQPLNYNGRTIYVEIGLTHVAIGSLPIGTVEAGTPLNVFYGPYGSGADSFAHLHLTVRTYPEENQGYWGDRTFYDPLELLPDEYNAGTYKDYVG